MIFVLAVQIGCPDQGGFMGFLQIVGFVALVLVVGVLLATAWDIHGARLQKRREEE